MTAMPYIDVMTGKMSDSYTGWHSSQPMTATEAMYRQNRLDRINTYEFTNFDVVNEMASIATRYKIDLFHTNDIEFNAIHSQAIDRLRWRTWKGEERKIPISYKQSSVSRNPFPTEPVNTHKCSVTCKEGQDDFYKGIANFYMFSHPEIYKTEEKICKKPVCLVTRIKQKIK